MAWLVDFIKEKEGYRSKAYQDSVGVWTVGYGSTYINGDKVASDDEVTREKAEMLLSLDLQDFLDYVISYGERHTYNWNRNQIAALTSFVYNLGKGTLKQLTQDGTRDNETIARKIPLYVNAGGRKLPGLVTRRNEEAEHFLL